MHYKFSEISHMLTPVMRTLFLMLKKSNTRTSVDEALTLALLTLKQTRKQMLNLKEDVNQNPDDKIDECIFFETALINIGLAIRFLQTRVVTPQNKPDLLTLIYRAYTHLKKSRDKPYR
jgi:hypothetical protein